MARNTELSNVDGHHKSRESETELAQAEDLLTDGRSPDVVVVEREGEYVAVDDSTVVSVGSDGIQVLNDGIDAAPAEGVIAVKGDFTADKSTGQVTVGEGKTLYCHRASLTIDDLTDTSDFDAGIKSEGSLEAENVSLSADGSRGDTTVALDDASAFESGMVIVVRSDKAVRDEGGGSSERTWGESHYVRGVSGSDVLLEDELQTGYLQSDNAEAYAIYPDQVHIIGLTIDGTNPEDEVVGIKLQRCSHPTVEDSEIKGCGDYGVRVQDSYRTRVVGCEIRNCNMDGQGYGVGVIYASSHTLIESNIIDECRHCVAQAGAPNALGLVRDTRVTDNVASAAKSSVFDAHGDVISWTVEGNTIHSRDTIGVMCGAVWNKVVDNDIHSNGHRTIWDRGNIEEDTVHIVKDNDIYGEGIGYGMSLSRHPSVEKAVYEGNEIHGSAVNPLHLSGGSIDMLVVRDNDLYGDDSDSGETNRCIDVRTQVTGVAIIEDNYMERVRRTGIHIIALPEHVAIQGNTVRNVNQDGNGAHACVRVDGVVSGGFVRDNLFVEENGNNPNMVIARDSSTKVEISHNRAISANGLDSSTAIDLDGDGSCWRHHNVGYDDSTSSAPSSPDEGTQYLDDGTNRSGTGWRVFLDGAWVDL